MAVVGRGRLNRIRAYGVCSESSPRPHDLAGSNGVPALVEREREGFCRITSK